MLARKNFFTSGWELEKTELDLEIKFQMINIALILSTIGLITGIVSNYINNISGLIPMEIFFIVINIVLFFLLRYSQSVLNLVSLIEALQFTFLFLVLIYISEPEQMKHVWIFTYPILLLYFQNDKSFIYWVLFMVFMLIIAPIQPFIEVGYTQFQVIYLSIVLIIISIIVYFYQIKIIESRTLIKEQVEELLTKDKLLTLQSKQAVMGEMISMIAHQWRQPLSTVTLSISDLQVKKMLGRDIDDEFMNKSLQDISDTIVYLSKTIDDFQTYFAPNKAMNEENICEIISRCINFTKVRIEGSTIRLSLDECRDEVIQTYANELVQVILNIINNAIDELIESKTLNPTIQIKIINKVDFFEIFIIDNGEGISPENLESIFEPYYSTKGKNGTGLGLYMSQMIMQKQFNSQIEVKSQKGTTEFSIQVPKKLV